MIKHRNYLCISAVLINLIFNSAGLADRIFLNPSNQTGNAVHGGGNEAQYALIVANLLKSKLEAIGHEVIVDQDRINAPGHANQWGADVFISIHTNGTDGTGDGTETFYFNGGNSGSYDLAASVLNGLLSQLGLRDRGPGPKLDTQTYFGQIGVLRELSSLIPGTLEEALFHDNPAEAAILRSVAGRSNIAQGIYDGIVSNPPTSGISITSPTSGSNWAMYTPRHITWVPTSTSTMLIHLYNDEFGDAEGVVHPINNNAPNNGDYEWLVSEWLVQPDDGYYIAMSDGSNYGESERFTISNGVRVTHPNGGQTINIGDNYLIRWDRFPNTSQGLSYVRIHLYKGGKSSGNIYDIITNQTFNDGSFTWPVLSSDVEAGNDYYMAVSGSSDNGNSWDFSDNNFSIQSSPTLSVSPTSGTQVTTTFTVTGSNYTPNGTVDRFVQFPGESFQQISSISANPSGNISWDYTPDCTHPVGVTRIYVVDVATNRQSNTITETVTANATCQSVTFGVSPASGPQVTTTFTVTGSNYTPSGTIDRFVQFPGESFQQISSISADPSGDIRWEFTPDCNHPVGVTRLYVIDVATNRQSNTITETVTVNSTCQSVILGVSPSSGPQVTTTFTVTGSKYTPNGTVDRFVQLPGESFQQISSISADPSGDIRWEFTPDCSHPMGITRLYVVDVATNRQSNTITETVTVNSNCSGQNNYAFEWQWPRNNPYTASNDYSNPREYGRHTGIDVHETSSGLNGSVLAVADGVVEKIFDCNDCKYDGTPDSDNNNMQNVVILRHALPDGGGNYNGGTIYSLYAHLGSINSSLFPGQTIIRNAVLGTSGVQARDGTKFSHTHLEIKNLPIRHNPSGAGPHWGYTPSSPNDYGYWDPWIFIHTISGISPHSGSEGTEVIIEGSRFNILSDAANAKVEFGGSRAALVSYGENRISITAPAGSGIVHVRLVPTKFYQFKSLPGGVKNWMSFTYSVEPNTFNVPVVSGWNMLALPLQVQNNIITAVFPSVDPQNVWQYDAGSGYSHPTSVNFGRGYWFRFFETTSTTIRGTAQNGLSFSLKKGWNLVGGISSNISLNEIIQTPPNSIQARIYHWNAQKGSYETPSSIEPGKGYWIYAYNDCKITMNKSVSTAKIDNTSMRIEDDIKELNAIEIEDNQKHSMKLYFGKYPDKSGDMDKYILPPIGPKGTFDARFANDRFVSILENGETDHHIRLQSNDYPIVLTWDELWNVESILILIDAVGEQLLGQNNMGSSGSFTISDSRIDRLIIRSVSLETTNRQNSFFLGPNYPNPFNPNTTIRFTVATKTRVKIVIYDILGFEIKRVIDRVMSPGNYTVEWNGRSNDGTNVSSGIYMYRMTANGFTKVRKMLFEK